MNIDNDVLDLLTDGQDGDALELHRERTGLDHDEAVAHIQAAKRMTHEIVDGDPAVEEIDALLRSRHKIEAIKVARTAYRIGLREAKELIDERQVSLGLRTPGVGFSLFGLFRKAG